MNTDFNLILSHNSLKEITTTIDRISNFDSTILLTGESGTGKSALAKYIHLKSKRHREPFVTIDCATIPENLIESELFGYAPGAFTGANAKGKAGKVELADKGTLFLDEIGLLPLNLQAKFLNLIQERTYSPIGSLETRRVNIRVISATNLDLRHQIKERCFREDLYYRLRVIEFYLPPLRERQSDILLLIEHFITQYNQIYHVQKNMSRKASELLTSYHWPGNIRELQYVIERMIVTSPANHMMTKDVPPEIGQPAFLPLNAPDSCEACDFTLAVEAFEKRLLTEAFKKYKSSYKLAQALNISQTKASRLLRKYHIQ